MLQSLLSAPLQHLNLMHEQWAGHNYKLPRVELPDKKQIKKAIWKCPKPLSLIARCLAALLQDRLSQPYWVINCCFHKSCIDQFSGEVPCSRFVPASAAGRSMERTAPFVASFFFRAMSCCSGHRLEAARSHDRPATTQIRLLPSSCRP